jgi:hypothetical protein
MPDLCRPRRGTRARLDSAVASLLRLGVPPERIVAESAGPGWPAGVVARQEPAPGTPLAARTRIVLSVGGAGALDTLPFPLRDADDGHLRVGALLALTDNPLLKLGIFVRRAGGLFAPSGDDPAAALRWMDLFGLSSAPWPRELWPGVARLLPSLHRVAGRAEAIPLALGIVFGLPVAGVRVVASSVEHAASTRLGGSHTRLGVDTVLAGEALVGSSLEIQIGPVTLDAYLDHESRRAQREALYRLVLPAHLARVEERWTAGDPLAGSRLGEGGDPPLLGINSRLAGAA